MHICINTHLYTYTYIYIRLHLHIRAHTLSHTNRVQRDDAVAGALDEARQQMYRSSRLYQIPCPLCIRPGGNPGAS